MVVDHLHLLMSLKHYAKKWNESSLRTNILDLDEKVGTAYDVYELRSRLEPVLNDLNEFIDNPPTTLSPIELVELIDEIAQTLRDEMNTSDINFYLSRYNLEFEAEEITSSKRNYVKSILSSTSEEKILKIAQDLGLYSDMAMLDVQQMPEIDNDYIKEYAEKCRIRIQEGDYEGAITSARTLVETVCMHILDISQVEYEKDGKIMKLYRQVSQVLRMDPSLYESDTLRQIASGFFSIIQGLAGLRNDLGDAHGRGGKVYRASKRHAILAVNAAYVVSDYLLDCCHNVVLKFD